MLHSLSLAARHVGQVLSNGQRHPIRSSSDNVKQITNGTKRSLQPTIHFSIETKRSLETGANMQR